MKWQQNKRSKALEQRIREDAYFWQSMRELGRSDQALARTIRDYAERAVQAERDGNHALAVRMAGEAARLKQYQSTASAVKDTVTVAHSVRTANQAMGSLLESVRGAANGLFSGPAFEDAARAQTDLALVQAQVQVALDQHAALCEDMLSPEDEEASQEGERYLQALMEDASRAAHRRILSDTNQCLNQLNQSRELS